MYTFIDLFTFPHSRALDNHFSTLGFCEFDF